MLLFLNTKIVYMAVNKAILLGHVGKDPDVKYFENDVSVAHFTLATTEKGFRTRDGQEIPDRTEWHNIVAWRGLAKIAENYIKKGSQIYVEGKIRMRSYDDQTGVKRYISEIYADTIQLLGKKPEGDMSIDNQPINVKPQVQQTNSSIEVQQVQNEDNYLPTVSDVEDDLPF